MINQYDIIVVGSGHAGTEAAYAAARMGKNVLLLTMNLDSIAFLACNPSIGGTAKGQLAGEVTALGGAMGVVSDKTALQMRVLNSGKGPAVQSLRAQVDKDRYHLEMKAILENASGLTIVQAEVKDLMISGGVIKGVRTVLGKEYFAAAVIICTGVYLDSDIIIGEYIKKSGPNGYSHSEYLSSSIVSSGHSITRFKTGTPARIHAGSVDFDAFEVQPGETSLSFGSNVVHENMPCYLGYTNEATHHVIRQNISLAPVYNGTVLGVGPRYCPSIETKVVRFADKTRHQIFLEPEAKGSRELYVQGLSTSFGADMQERIYRSIKGLEDVKIMRYAYAIEYDCIDPTTLYPTLESKVVSGLYFAGQVNGTSGYEEAAAQGIMSGINAVLKIDSLPAFVLKRNEAYIGVLIDDLVTRGVDEPYRMMTSRAEYRLLLRQDNCDIRLKKYGIQYRLISGEDVKAYNDKMAKIDSAYAELDVSYTPRQIAEYFGQIGENIPNNGMKLREILRRNKTDVYNARQHLGVLKGISDDVMRYINTEVKYAGYIAMQETSVRDSIEAENMSLPTDTDYDGILALRVEARQKLSKIRPLSIGQASRISGVSPSDINVLIIYLKTKAHKK